MDEGLPRPVVLFDGVCNLCSATVRWIVKHDASGRFRFASLQSEAAHRLLVEATRQLPIEATLHLPVETAGGDPTPTERSVADSVLEARGSVLEAQGRPDSIVLVDQDGVHFRSDAAIRIAKGLGPPWSVLGLLVVVPRPIRDATYDFVARNRYKWFGRQDSCSLPAPELADRFLDSR